MTSTKRMMSTTIKIQIHHPLFVSDQAGQPVPSERRCLVPRTFVSPYKVVHGLLHLSQSRVCVVNAIAKIVQHPSKRQPVSIVVINPDTLTRFAPQLPDL